jgi:hypothetical protein
MAPSPEATAFSRQRRPSIITRIIKFVSTKVNVSWDEKEIKYNDIYI